MCSPLVFLFLLTPHFVIFLSFLLEGYWCTYLTTIFALFEVGKTFLLLLWYGT